jgi:hypothetical protein
MISNTTLEGIIEDGLNSKMGQVAIADKYRVGILSIKSSSSICTYIILFLLYYNHDALNTAMPSSIEFPFDPTASISFSFDLVSYLESRINMIPSTQ